MVGHLGVVGWPCRLDCLFDRYDRIRDRGLHLSGSSLELARPIAALKLSSSNAAVAEVIDLWPRHLRPVNRARLIRFHPFRRLFPSKTEIPFASFRQIYLTDQPLGSSSCLFILNQRPQPGRLGKLQHVGQLIGANIAPSVRRYSEISKHNCAPIGIRH